MTIRGAVINGVYVENPSNEDLNTGARHQNDGNYQRRVQRADQTREFIQPFVGGKPNPDFARAYPKQAKITFTQEEMEAM